MNVTGPALALAAAAALTASYLAVPAIHAQEPEDAPFDLVGRVINGTPDGESVANIIVTLHQEGAGGHEHRETPADDDGRFVFEDVTSVPGVVYGVSVRYKNTLYGTDLDLSGGAPGDLSITVYDTGDDPEMLAGGSVSVLFAGADPVTQTVSALEIVTIINDSDRTYVPGAAPMGLVRFGLPPDSQDLQVDSSLIGADVVQVDRGFAILGNLPPGVHEVMYTYRFPYDGTGAAYSKSLPFGAQNLRVLAPVEALDLLGDDGRVPQSVRIGERQYQLLESEGLERGATVSVSLSGLPARSLWHRTTDWFGNLRFQYAGPVVIGIILTALAVYGVRMRPRELTAATNDVMAIRRMLAELEQEFHDGSIAESDYARRRKVLEQRLAYLVEL